MSHWLKKEYGRHRSFWRYLLAGCFNTALNYLVYALLIGFTSVSVEWSQAIGHLVGTASSFLTNRYFAFNDRSGEPLSEVARFIIINAITLGLSVLLIYLLNQLPDASPYLIKIPVTIGIALLNYVGYKRFVFARPGTARSRKAQDHKHCDGGMGDDR